MTRRARICLLSLLFAVPALRAEETVTRYFAGGPKVDAVLEKDEEGKLHLSVSQFDEQQNEESLLSTELTEGQDGEYLIEDLWTDDNLKEHKLTGRVTISGKELSYSGLKTDDGAKLTFPASGGPWQEVTPEERLVHAKTRYEAADKILNDAWAMETAEIGKGLPAMKKAQRDWLEYRDMMSKRATWDIARMAGKAETEEEVNHESYPEYWNLMTSLTTSRTPIVLAWSGKGVPAGRSGTYRDSFGGEITVQEKKDGLHFEINVVRGPTAHLGEVKGVAKLKGDTAVWTDAEKPVGEKVAKVTLKFNANKSLSVETENADAYHGMRAYFDSTYFKERRKETKSGGK